MNFSEYLINGCDQALTWRGHTIWKNPLDLMIYNEIVFEVKPTLVIETGSFRGGSALFWADMMRRHHERVEVLSVDLERPQVWDPDVRFLIGSSLSSEIVHAISVVAQDHERVLVNLDSSHSQDHVADELTLYCDFVSVGSYLIVEDTIDDLRLDRPGALAACLKFLASHPEFQIDPKWERLPVTNCPNGFLRRIA